MVRPIRYCTRCLQVCHAKMDVMSCVYNPFTRRELEWGDLKPAAPKRRIVIVGAVLICCLATIHPARGAARLDPAEALRYE